MRVSRELLIDTNVVIGLEDPQPVQDSLAELVRLSSEHAVGLFVDGANYDDVARDRDAKRRAVTSSKLNKFQRLQTLPIPDDVVLVARFGSIKSDNDRSDVRLLVALDTGAVDFLITQDGGLHRRADKINMGTRVLTIEEALEWLKQTFIAKTVVLPYVIERKAYEITLDQKIFDSLRIDYPNFDAWFEKCKREHRNCWVLELDKQIAGLVIRKNETHAEAHTLNLGPKILKICTFKVRDEFQGEKFGELLLKQILWFAQRNKYDLVYVTVYPKHEFLTDLLAYYGFSETMKLKNDEAVFEKAVFNGPLSGEPRNAFASDRMYYPRFLDGGTIRKFCVPIRPEYHRRLFPEIAFATELPLFPKETFRPILSSGQGRTPGNTIRKVYLCRAKTSRLRPGDLLLFYMSKDERYAASQAITTVGIVEQAVEVMSTDKLIRQTAKRSVFSAEDLNGLNPSPSSPVRVIDFLMAGHIEPPVGLTTLLREGVFANRPPQSIAEFPEQRYLTLRPHIRLGFDI